MIPIEPHTTWNIGMVTIYLGYTVSSQSTLKKCLQFCTLKQLLGGILSEYILKNALFRLLPLESIRRHLNRKYLPKDSHLNDDCHSSPE